MIRVKVKEDLYVHDSDVDYNIGAQRVRLIVTGMAECYTWMKDLNVSLGIFSRPNVLPPASYLSILRTHVVCVL